MPWASVRENVRLPLKLAHVAGRRRTRASVRRWRKSGLPNLPTPTRANYPAA